LNEPDEISYRVAITGLASEITSDAAAIEYFDLSNALDNDAINYFTPNDSSSVNYIPFLIKGDEAWDGKVALKLIDPRLIVDPEFVRSLKSLFA